jgi:hypothetical protein
MEILNSKDDVVVLRSSILEESKIYKAKPEEIVHTGEGIDGFERVEVIGEQGVWFMPVPPGTELKKPESTLMGAYKDEGGDQVG